MKLEINNATTTVRDATKDELSTLFVSLSYLSKTYVRGQWVHETKSMFSRRSKTFLTGLLPKAIAGLRNHGVTFSASDIRQKSKPPIWPVDLGPVALRGYQNGACEAFLSAKRGIIQAGTGGGKTIMAAAITRACQVPTLFIVHRTHLLYQTAEKFVHCMPELKKVISIVGDGNRDFGPLTMATVQTLDSMLKKYGKPFEKELLKFKLLIVDEAHRASSSQFNNIIRLTNNCDYRLGLSATPFMSGEEHDDLQLIGAFGKVVYHITASELIRQGVLARPFFKWYEVTEPRLGKLKNWRDVYEKLIINNEIRNKMIAAKTAELVRMKKKTLVIASEIKHIEILLELLRGHGLNVGVATGSASASERKKILDRLDQGGHDCILCSSIFDEGVDLPNIGGVVLAAGNKSAPALLQRTGRAIRAKEDGQNYAVIIDFYDRTHKMLESHSIQRIAIVQSEPEFRIL